MNFLSKALLWITVFLIGVFSLGLQYYLPATEKVQLLGTEVKRTDPSKKDQKTRDIRFVVAKDLDSGKTLMFRNEDMMWPPYFKFASGDLSGEVMNLEETSPDAVVLVTYYGWRLPWFSLYPNVVSVEKVDPQYDHVPWFNIIFLGLLALGVARLWVAFNRSKFKKKLAAA